MINSVLLWSDFIKRFKVKTEFRLIGGEPTLHKDLPKIIKEATALGHRTAIATNGLRISHYDYLKELKGLVDVKHLATPLDALVFY